MRVRATCVAVVSALFAGCGGGGGGVLPPGPTPTPGNQAPTVSVTGPSLDVESAQGASTVVTVTYIDADTDSVATTDLIADPDGNLATPAGQIAIATGRPDQDGGAQSVPWVLAGVPAATYKVFARTTDGTTTVVGSASGFVLVNAPPSLNMPLMSVDVTVSRGAIVPVRYVDNDADDVALTWLWADLDGNRDTTGDTFEIAAARPENLGVPQTVQWDTTGVDFGYYNIMGQTWDGTNQPALRTATGRVNVVNSAFATRAGDLGNDMAEDVATFSDGASVVVGSFDADTVFGAGEFFETSLTNAGNADLFVARYFADGFLDWAVGVGSVGAEYATGVVSFSDGSCIVTGAYEGTVTFGPGEANQTTLTATGSSQDLFLARFNANGTLAWAKRAGGSNSAAFPQGIAAHADGSVVVTGLYGNDVTFGPGEGGATTLLNVFGTSSWDGFVARYNATGTLAWAKRFTGSFEEMGTAVDTFPDGSCVVTGNFTSPDAVFGGGEANATTMAAFGFQEVFVAKFGTTGLLTWAKQQGGFEGVASGIDVSTFSDGSCVVSGWFMEFMDFGFGEPNETNFLAQGSSDAFVARFNTTGQLAWATAQGGVGFDSGQGIETLADGSFVVSGYFDGLGSFGFGDPNWTLLFSQSFRDLFLAEFAGNGQLHWVRQAGGTTPQVVPTALALHADGSLGITGYFDDDGVGGNGVLFGAGGNLEWAVFSAGLLDVFNARYNADGGF